MAKRGLFIGVSRHSDPTTPELNGAALDARALHALFSDAMPELAPELLVDAEATRERISEAIARVVRGASPEDTLIVSFSGHGTRSHRIVPYDVDKVRLAETTIDMADIAAAFKTSRARAILFVLDCCFAGGANARVLQDTPTPRDIKAPLEDLAGEGRILLAAANVNEEAWEMRGGGHGLLTKALMDTLLAAEGEVDIYTAMAQITSVVRAEAARMGHVQNPVLVGHIAGGLALPALRRGPAFLAAFPGQAGARVGRGITQLATFGLPASVLDVWAAAFPEGLNELQLSAVNEARVLDGQSVLAIAPTGSGKTFVGEMAAMRAVTQGKKAVFLLPYRALVSEKYEHFTFQYAGALGLRVLRCSGDYQDQTGDFLLGRYDLALLTFEMFLRLALDKPQVLDALGLVVLDEAQFITDPNRGINVELLLTALVSTRAQGAAIQLVVLSAVIGDVNHLDGWLNASCLFHEKRPIPLTEGVLDRSGTFVYASEDGKRQQAQLLQPREIVQRKKSEGVQDVLVPLASKLIRQGERLLVFRNRRGTARGSAKYLAADLSLPSAADVVAELPRTDPSSASEELRTCLRGGTAFHTTDLSRGEKALVEREFRKKDGAVRVVCATTTLAAGVNTVASTVVIAEQEFLGEDGRPFTVAEYKNMAGRAGRIDFSPTGRSVILADTPSERERLFQTYVLGKPEPMRSSFNPADPSAWLLRLLAQEHQVRRSAVASLLVNTYGGYLATRRDPAWSARVETQINAFLDEMLSLGFLETESDRIQLTLVGRACGQSSLSLASCLRLVGVLRSPEAAHLSAEALMAIVQMLPESDGGYTPLMRGGTAESVRTQQAIARYGRGVGVLLQRYVKDNGEWLARCKRAAILWDWTHGVPIEQIEREYTPNPFQGVITLGDTVRFADTTRFHLASAHRIASVLLLESVPDEKQIDDLLRRLQVGIPTDLLDLLALPIALDRGAYLVLGTQGIKDRAALATKTDAQLEPLLGATAVRALVGAGAIQATMPTAKLS